MTHGKSLHFDRLHETINKLIAATFSWVIADDTNIFVLGKDENEVYSKANIVLGKVCEYLYDNQLHINKEKICFMHFHTRLNSKSRLTCARIRPHGSEFTLNLGDKKVKKGDHFEFLGVVKHLKSKLCAAIIIKRIKRYILKSECINICNSLFMSHLSYCISAWGGISKYKLQFKIFAIQKTMTTHNSMKLVQELEQLIGMKRRRIFVLNTQNHSLMRTVFFF